MQTKFKPNDKVFYFVDDYVDCDFIDINYVVSIETARKHYCGYIYDEDGYRTGMPSIEIIRGDSFKHYNCEPVFIVTKIGGESVGWMPENQLHLYTKAVKLLFQK